MFANKPEDTNPSPPEAVSTPASFRPAALKDVAPTMPPRKPVIRPEVVRSSRDYSMSGSGREDMGYRSYGEGKKLIVGRGVLRDAEQRSATETGSVDKRVPS